MATKKEELTILANIILEDNELKKKILEYTNNNQVCFVCYYNNNVLHDYKPCLLTEDPNKNSLLIISIIKNIEQLEAYLKALSCNITRI